MSLFDLCVDVLRHQRAWHDASVCASVVSMPTTARRNPGEVTTGDWAHVKWNQRQHLVTAVDDDPCQPVRFACGQRSEVFRVWHDPALPHLPKCRRCEKAA